MSVFGVKNIVSDISKIWQSINPYFALNRVWYNWLHWNGVVPPQKTKNQKLFDHSDLWLKHK